MKIKFLADADLNEDIIAGLLRREPGFDFQTANEARLHGLNDLEVLALAAQEGRLLVSHDRKTMPKYFGEFIQTAASPGLLIISQRTDLFSAIEELILIWVASDSEEWVNRISTIPL